MKKLSVFDLPTKYSNILAAGLITLTLVIPFGLQIGQLGLYGDDWANVLFPSTLNGVGGWVQTVLINFVGTQPLPYHLISLLLFFVVAFLLHKVLIHIGLDTVSALTAAILAQVFPAFSQSVSALAFFPVLLGLVLAFSAAIFFIKCAEISAKKVFYFIGGLFCSIVSVLLSPFSAILMGLIFLVFISGWWERQAKEKVGTGILSAILLIGSISSLLLFSVDKTLLNFSLLTKSIRVWLDAFVSSWRQIIAFPQEGSQTIIYFVLIIIASVLFYLGLRVIEKTSESSEENQNFSYTKLDIKILLSSAAVGFIFIILSKAFGIALSTQYSDDTGMLVVGIMAAIFITLAVKLILVAKYRLAVLAVLIVLSTGTRFTQINRYGTENARLEDILSQLAVRGDAVKPGTVLASEQLPLNYTTQKAIDALLQKMFNKDAPISSNIYINADTPEFRDFLQDEFRKETELRIADISTLIKKDALIGFWVGPDGCVQILDDKTEDAQLPQGLKYLVPLSSPDLLISNRLSDVLQLRRFRTTIENDWCFYYQLAGRQAAGAKWDDVLLTYDAAEKQGLKPQAFYDQLPLIEASLRQNPIPISLELSKEIISSPEQKNIICTLWNEYKLESDLNKEVLTEIQNSTLQLQCDN